MIQGLFKDKHKILNYKLFHSAGLVDPTECLLLFAQGLLEFIWTEGCSGRSSNPGPTLAILHCNPLQGSTGFLQGSPCEVFLQLHALAVYRV